MVGRCVPEGCGSDKKALAFSLPIPPPATSQTKNTGLHRKPVEGVLCCGKDGWDRDKEEMAAAWATCGGPEATQMEQLFMGGELRKSQKRRKQGQGRCAATCLQHGWKCMGQQQLSGGPWEESGPFLWISHLQDGSQ